MPFVTTKGLQLLNLFSSIKYTVPLGMFSNNLFGKYM